MSTIFRKIENAVNERLIDPKYRRNTTISFDNNGQIKIREAGRQADLGGSELEFIGFIILCETRNIIWDDLFAPKSLGSEPRLRPPLILDAPFSRMDRMYISEILTYLTKINTPFILLLGPHVVEYIAEHKLFSEKIGPIYALLQHGSPRPNFSSFEIHGFCVELGIEDVAFDAVEVKCID